MTRLTLDDEEAEVLREALGTYVSDLRMEVAATDRYELREKLKREEALLLRIVQALGGTTVA